LEGAEPPLRRHGFAGEGHDEYVEAVKRVEQCSTHTAIAPHWKRLIGPSSRAARREPFSCIGTGEEEGMTMAVLRCRLRGKSSKPSTVVRPG
jgi:hypothetical protein